MDGYIGTQFGPSRTHQRQGDFRRQLAQATQTKTAQTDSILQEARRNTAALVDNFKKDSAVILDKFEKDSDKLNAIMDRIRAPKTVAVDCPPLSFGGALSRGGIVPGETAGPVYPKGRAVLQPEPFPS